MLQSLGADVSDLWMGGWNGHVGQDVVPEFGVGVSNWPPLAR